MNYRGFYINLDRSEERRANLERQLDAAGLRAVYQRFPASEGNALNAKVSNVSPGNVGCFSSHYRLLKSQANANEPVHVVEDDVLLAPQTGAIIESLINNGVLNTWDLLFTEVALPLQTEVLQELTGRFRECTTLHEDGTVKTVNRFCLLPLKQRVFASTTSYIVHQNSVGKVANILEQAAQSEISKPIDLFYRKQIWEGRLTAACLFPFITTVDMQHSVSSNISPANERRLENSLLSSMVLRNLFFIGGKPEALLQISNQALPAPETDVRAKVLSRLFQFAVSPHSVGF